MTKKNKKRNKKIEEKQTQAKKYLWPFEIRNEIIILFLFIISLGLRLIYMNPGLFESDSVGVAIAVEETYKTGNMRGTFNGRYGSTIINLLTYIPYHLITGIESAEKTIILTEIFFASFSVIILFLFLQRIFDNKFISLIAALLFSISPIFLSVTTYGNAIGLEIFFILASFYMLADFHKTNSRIRLAMSSSFIAFSVMIRESALIFIPFYFLFYLNPVIKNSFTKDNGKFISFNQEVFKSRNLIAAFIPFLLIFGAYVYYFFYNILYKTLFIPDDGSGKIVEFLGFFSIVFEKSIKDLIFDLNILGIVLFIGGLIIFWKSFENKFYFIFFLLWAGLFLYFGNTSTYSPYYLAIISIPFFVFISVFLNYLYKENRILGIICIAFIIFLLFAQIRPILDYRHKFSGEKEYALWVKDQVPSDSKVIVMNDDVFFNYYGHLDTLGHPIGDPEATNTLMKDINSLLKNGTNMYIVDSAYSYDPGRIFLIALYQNFDIEGVGMHMVEDYHKATILDTRYNEGLYKINKVITPEELLEKNIVYKANISRKGFGIYFDFTNTDKTPLRNSSIKVEAIIGNDYFTSLDFIGDINPGETKELMLNQRLATPIKIMVWNEDLNSWMIVYRGQATGHPT